MDAPASLRAVVPNNPGSLVSAPTWVPTCVPELLPPGAHAFAVRPTHDPADIDLTIPGEPRRRSIGRHWEFAAGRHCAARAIRGLTGMEPDAQLGRGPLGEPLWPNGLTGSITHTRDFVWAVVARTIDVFGIGIDAEPVVHDDRAAAVASLILHGGEGRRVESLPPALALTLVFSAKESVFKCLSPLLRYRFYYDAVELMSVNVGTGRFTASTTGSLAARWGGRPRVLEGRWQLSEGRVHTAVWFPGPVN